MIKKLAIALSLALVLVLSIGTACLASDEPFEITWNGGVCGGEVAVAGSVCTSNTATEFSSSGCAISGVFNAASKACGETCNSLAAVAAGGKISYSSKVGDENKGAKVAIFTKADCEAVALVETETSCDEMKSEFGIGAEGCNFKTESQVETWDCDEVSMVAAFAEGKDGAAAMAGELCDDSIASVTGITANGKGNLAVIAASTEKASINGVEVKNGSIALVAEFCQGVDALVAATAGK